MGLALVYLYLPLFSFFVLLGSGGAQTNGTVAINSSITANAKSVPWLSPSGEFAFGFLPLEGNDLFLLSIWYAKIPEQTTVWYPVALAENGAAAAAGSKVTVSVDKGLVLTGPGGEQLWYSSSVSGVVSKGVMKDTGNFVLEDSSSQSLWESFSNPADTILPGQNLGAQERLSSRLLERNFSKGRYELAVEDGNLKCFPINLPSTFRDDAYWTIDPDSNESSSTGKQLRLNESGYLYILKENNQTFALTPSGAVLSRDAYHRATLNFDGVLTQYQRSKSSDDGVSWTSVRSTPDNICTAGYAQKGTGPCGYNGVCRLGDDNRARCSCPIGFSLVNPADPFAGCKQEFIPSCEDGVSPSPQDSFTIEVITNTDWPLSDMVQLQPFTEEQCRESCREDCMCAVAIFRAGDSCWKKKLPLSNGRIDNSLNSKAFIKVPKNNATKGCSVFPEEKNKKKNKDTLILVGSVLLGSSMIANFVLVGALCFGCFVIYSRDLKTRSTHGEDVETNLRCFTYRELVDATSGFKEELGRGAFGIVYKGSLQTSVTRFVAVKKLNSVMANVDKEFKTEMNVIGQTHHKNLVRLLGFCNEGQQRLLVYEYLSNGALASFLFGDSKPTWGQRTHIAYGIARGLLYLHEECSTQIIHCDIKPQNILLDDYYNARISDFGLAKLLKLDQSHTNTNIRGTKGYVAPEWFRRWPVTAKVDVYSFGVLLLEIVCCRKNVDMETEDDRAILIEWAFDRYREGCLDALVEFDEEALHDKEKLGRFVMTAIWCIQEDPSLRPGMRTVVQMLEGIVEVTKPPSPFPFSYTTETSRQ